jgi:hypothetical protein
MIRVDGVDAGIAGAMIAVQSVGFKCCQQCICLRLYGVYRSMCVRLFQFYRAPTSRKSCMVYQFLHYTSMLPIRNRQARVVVLHSVWQWQGRPFF